MQIGAGQLTHLILGVVAATITAVLPACAEPRLTFTASHDWALNEAWFGGFSALEMDADGQAATLLTDRGSLLRVTFERAAETIERVSVLSKEVLRDESGRPLRGFFRDAEGLATGRDGRSYASFEYRHRVMQLEVESGRLSPLPDHPDFSDYPDNQGLEALAIHPDGTLFALQEAPADQDGSAPLYSYRDGAWRISHAIPLTRPFVPVGADFDSDGHLFILERTVTPLGFRSRIRRFDPETGQIDILLSSIPGRFDNLEAISVWSDPEGHTRITTLSDDNFLPFQRTQFVEFMFTE